MRSRLGDGLQTADTLGKATCAYGNMLAHDLCMRHKWLERAHHKGRQAEVEGLSVRGSTSLHGSAPDLNCEVRLVSL